MELNVPVDNSPLTVDCSVMANPLLLNGPNGGYIEMSNKVEAFYGGNRTESPFTPPPMSVPAANAATRMVTVYISDYVTNTVGTYCGFVKLFSLLNSTYGLGRGRFC